MYFFFFYLLDFLSVETGVGQTHDPWVDKAHKEKISRSCKTFPILVVAKIQKLARFLSSKLELYFL